MDYTISTPNFDDWTLYQGTSWDIPIYVDVISGGPGNVNLSAYSFDDSVNFQLDETRVLPSYETILFVETFCDTPVGPYTISIDGAYSYDPYSGSAYSPAVIYDDILYSTSITIDIIANDQCGGNVSHYDATIEPASGSGAPGCEDYSECYFPVAIQVDVGDTIGMINTDSAAHTFTSGTAADGSSGIFDSGMLMSGDSFEYTPYTPGEIPYYCVVHPWMEGIIFVIDPDGIDEWEDYNLGLDYYDSGNLSAALDAFFRSLALHPDDYDTFMWIASIYGEQGKWQDMISILQKGLSYHPNDAYLLEGITYADAELNRGGPGNNGNSVVVDFDSINARNHFVSGYTVENYLTGYGITVVDEGNGPLRDFVIWEWNRDISIFGIADSSPNGFFRNFGNEAYSYSFYFDAPLDRFEFTRASYDASYGGIATSPWNAQAFDQYGNSLGTVGEGSGSYYSTPPPQVYSFNGPEISHVTFYRDSVNTFAGIAQVPLDDLVLVYSDNSFNTEPSFGGYSSWEAFCVGEYGSEYYYDAIEDVCAYYDDSQTDDLEISPELERLFTLGLEEIENGNCESGINYFKQALSLKEYESVVLFFIGTGYACLDDLETALSYMEDSIFLARSDPEIPDEFIVEIQNLIVIIKDAISTIDTISPPPSTQYLDATGTWKGTSEFSVWFDYYPAPVTCTYFGNVEMKLRQTGDSITGSSTFDVTKSTTPTGCFSWHESYGYGSISGDLFGSAFSGTLNSNQLTGSFTSDLFRGKFSQQGDNNVSGEFTLMREGAPTVPESKISPTIPYTPPSIITNKFIPPTKSVTPTPSPIPITPTPSPIPITPTPSPIPITPTPSPIPIPSTSSPTPVAPTPSFTPKAPSLTPKTTPSPTLIAPIPVTPTPTLPLIELEIGTDRTTYNQGNLVTIYTEIDGVKNNANIAISVIDPSGNIVMTRSLFIDDKGSIPFKVSHGTTAGSYKVTASVNVDGKNYEDTSKFTIKKDLAGLSIKSVSATNQQGNPVNSFSQGNQGHIKIVTSSESFMSGSLITVTILDSDLIVLGTSSIKTSISSGESEIILSYYIPDDTSVGVANIYVNAFTDWPSNGGIPLTRESSAEIGIGVATPPQSTITDTSPTPVIPTFSVQNTNVKKVTIPSGTGTPGCERASLCYFPSTIRINQGDTVEWNNKDSAAHTVTSGNPSDGLDSIFDSSLFMGGEKYTIDFNNIGTFDYFCMVHPWMEGKVIVK